MGREYIIIQLYIEGKGPFDFMVDSGLTTELITPRELFFFLAICIYCASICNKISSHLHYMCTIASSRHTHLDCTYQIYLSPDLQQVLDLNKSSGITKQGLSAGAVSQAR